MKGIFCDYAKGMFANDPRNEDEVPFIAHWAEMEETQYHEAGHAVVAFALSGGVDGIGLRINNVLGKDGKVGMIYSGVCYQTKSWNKQINWAVREGFYRWELLAFGIEMAAGAAAERKYCLSADRPLRTRETAESDHLKIDHVAMRLGERGRDPRAFERLVWRRAQLILEDPLIWSAVDELASALGGCWRDGDELGVHEELVDGESVRAWIREAGVHAGMLHPKGAMTTVADLFE
jgi:hypothetical protein